MLFDPFRKLFDGKPSQIDFLTVVLSNYMINQIFFYHFI